MSAPPQQPKQPSRKSKAAWRKNVDITSIQDGLETVRDEVFHGYVNQFLYTLHLIIYTLHLIASRRKRTDLILSFAYSGVIAEKPSSELFTLDISGNQSIQREYNKQHKPLKSNEILARRSAVPAIDSRRRPSLRVTDGVLETKRQRSGGVSRKELARLKRFARADFTHAENLDESGRPSEDIWGDQMTRSDVEKELFPFLEPAKPVHEPPTIRRGPVSLAASGKEIPAVQKPKPETSYNPQSTEYFRAFAREGEKEIQAELKRRREVEEEQQRQLRVEKAREDAEAYEKLVEAGEDSVWEGFESEWENESTPVAAQKRPERKTRAQRNKIIRRKEAEKKTMAEARLKDRNRQAGRIKEIVRSLDTPDRPSPIVLPTSTNADEQESSEEEVLLRKRRFGKAPCVDLHTTVLCFLPPPKTSNGSSDKMVDGKLNSIDYSKNDSISSSLATFKNRFDYFNRRETFSAIAFDPSSYEARSNPDDESFNGDRVGRPSLNGGATRTGNHLLERLFLFIVIVICLKSRPLVDPWSRKTKNRV